MCFKNDATADLTCCGLSETHRPGAIVARWELNLGPDLLVG